MKRPKVVPALVKVRSPVPQHVDAKDECRQLRLGAVAENLEELARKQRNNPVELFELGARGVEELPRRQRQRPRRSSHVRRSQSRSLSL